jgi:hypothetical protein
VLTSVSPLSVSWPACECELQYEQIKSEGEWVGRVVLRFPNESRVVCQCALTFATCLASSVVECLRPGRCQGLEGAVVLHGSEPVTEG